ncbi:MAG: LacI family transcriptional regulator [Spirochaetaceae bacterium]|jgi:LacI family transcriptional regulator|nr:LacI family transcriptional regulator [Spirochaetaceae bacterium]
MNIYDIAEEAKVSISTVSRVLNNKDRVTDETRGKIQAVLDKYNYTPNAIARGLVAKTMKTIAILSVDIRVPHYSRTAFTIEREFSKRSYNVIVCNTGGELEETRRYARAIAHRQVDGVVLVGSVFNDLCGDTEVSAALRGLPLVTANGQVDIPNAYSVLIDDYAGAELAVKHMAARGRQRDGIVYLKDLNTGSAKMKWNGFAGALERMGVDNAKDRVFSTSYGLEGGAAAVNEILRLNPRPSAIVCGEDLTAIGVMKGLAARGIRVPDDIAVSGYNNSEYSLLCSPELTSVDNKGEMCALLCVQLLESRINGSNAFSSVTIKPELVVRGSS